MNIDAEIKSAQERIHRSVGQKFRKLEKDIAAKFAVMLSTYEMDNPIIFPTPSTDWGKVIGICLSEIL